MIAAAASAIW